jgi:succinate dehydrogenase/fumarate reductase flavoprotein subunit
LTEIKTGEADTLYARNPHELMRALEALDILTCAEMVIHACRARKAGNRWLFFERLDYPENDPPAWRKWITIKQIRDRVLTGDLALDFYGSLPDNYAAHNK